MKTSQLLIRSSSVCAIVVALVIAGCSKKAETPPTPASAPTPAAPAKPATTTGAIDNAAKSAADALKDTAKKTGDAAAAAAAEVKQKTESAAAAAAAEVKQKLDAAAATPPPATAPAAPPAVTPPAAASLAAGQSADTLDALKAQATQLLGQYTGELEVLKKNAVAIKDIIDKNANLLPAGVAAKYQELNTLLPQLSTMVDTLKDYQKADLTTLIPKLKTDFAKAQSLYGEIKGLLPAM